MSIYWSPAVSGSNLIFTNGAYIAMGTTPPGDGAIRIDASDVGYDGYGINISNGGIVIAQGAITANTIPTLNMSSTFNNAGVIFTGIKYNVTDTASNAASLLMDLQVGGSSKWNVTKGGLVTAAGGVTITTGGLLVTAGNIGVGTAQTTNVGLNITRSLSGSTSESGIIADTTFDSSATSIGRAIFARGTTANSAFTVTSLYGVHVGAAVKGAASTVTNLYGIGLDAQTATCTNSYTLYIGASSGGSAINESVRVIPGTTGIRITGNSASNAASKTSILADTTFDSTTTSAAYVYRAFLATQAAAFTLTNGYGLYIDTPSKGAGSTITNAYGALIKAQNIGATNNYGLFVEAASAGSGSNISIVANVGDTGFTTTSATSTGTAISKTGVSSNFIADSTTTSAIYGLFSGTTTAAAAFTLTNRYGLYINNVAKGAGSTIINDYGIYIVGPTQGGTINASIWIAAGSVVLAGSGAALDTTATSGFTYLPTCAGTPTGVPALAGTGRAAMVIDSTNAKMYGYYGGAWVDLTKT